MGEPGLLDPPWARVTPARHWGFYVTFGVTPLAVTKSRWDGERRWWRRTQKAAHRKARTLIGEELSRRATEEARRMWDDPRWRDELVTELLGQIAEPEIHVGPCPMVAIAGRHRHFVTADGRPGVEMLDG